MNIIAEQGEIVLLLKGFLLQVVPIEILIPETLVRHPGHLISIVTNHQEQVILLEIADHTVTDLRIQGTIIRREDLHRTLFLLQVEVVILVEAAEPDLQISLLVEVDLQVQVQEVDLQVLPEVDASN